MTKQETCHKLIEKTRNLLKRKEDNKLLDISASNSVVAKNVRRIISEKGLKQSAIAQKSGFSPCEFNSMLNGRRIMRAVDISSIIIALDVDANELFKKEGE